MSGHSFLSQCLLVYAPQHPQNPDIKPERLIAFEGRRMWLESFQGRRISVQPQPFLSHQIRPRTGFNSLSYELAL